MGWGPTKEVIEKEANDYNELSFFRKSKNKLVSFIIVVTVWSYLVSIGSYPIDLLPIAIFNMAVASFVYFNHRWAIVVFAISYVGEKVFVVVLAIASSMSRHMILALILGVIVAILSYQSYRVATQLQKNADAKVD
ncbi:TPA: hypothetical protein EYO77_16245 [Candidatus Poribacteria bacterium]|nr:hypothetical protein [Candidatus Poribacteria bacterium]